MVGGGGEKLIKQGIASNDLPVVAGDSAAVLTRLHFAEALERHGYVSDGSKRLTATSVKANVLMLHQIGCSIDEAVTAIRAAGWFVLPGGGGGAGGGGLLIRWLMISATNGCANSLLNLKKMAVTPLKSVMSQQGPAQRQWLTELATDYELLGSVGSDFHKPSRFRRAGA